MYALSHVTIYRHVTVASVAIIMVSFKNTKNILMFIFVHFLVCYISVNIPQCTDMEHIKLL